MPRLVWLPLVALAASGCAGSIQTDEVDGFGPVASALWLYDDDNDYHQFVLTNVVGACGKIQAASDAYDDFENALEDLGPNEYDDYCAEMEEPTMAWARALDALYHEGARFLYVGVNDGGDTEPDEDEYDVGDDPGSGGTLSYLENSPYAAILQDYDPEEDDSTCGVDEDDAELDTDVWYLEDGTLEITTVNDEQSAAGRFEGELADPDGDGAGDITFSFSATYCEFG